MLRRLRRWLRKQFGAGLPVLRRPRGRSRYLVARFKDSAAAAGSRLSRYRELSYGLFLPSGSSHRDGLPLIVMLHGCKQDPRAFAAGTRMNTLAEKVRCAVLYPEQSQQYNPLRCWNWFESASLAGQGEAALIARLIDQVAVRRAIDPGRVYVAGMSAGGAMAGLLAVRHSRLFAACAIHSGVMFGAASSPLQALAAMRSGPSAVSIDKAQRAVCETGESDVIVPTLVIHGDSDTTVNPVNMDRLIEQLTQRAEFIDPNAGDVSASDGLRMEDGGRHYQQWDYRQGRRIVLRKVLVEGLGHAWSGGDPHFEFNDPNGPDASRLIMDFVSQYRREMPRIAVARAG